MKQNKATLCSLVMEQLNLHGEQALNFSFLAANTDVPLHVWQAQFASVQELIVCLQDSWQQDFLKNLEEIKEDLQDPSLSAKEVLHELLLRRLEGNSSNRRALQALWGYTSRDPLSNCQPITAYTQSLSWLLQAAGLNTSGPYGTLRQKALAAGYGEVLHVWFKDQSPSLDQTAAHIDKRLHQAEKIFPLIWRRD